MKREGRLSFNPLPTSSSPCAIIFLLIVKRMGDKCEITKVEDIISEEGKGSVQEKVEKLITSTQR